MRIVRVDIEEFGKLRGCTLEPDAGLTLIEGENESGKSTLLSFFRFALYGFPRKNSAEGEERDKRLSWRGRLAAGRLTVETEAGVFCVSRRAYLRADSLCEELTMLRLPEGEQVALEGKSPGEYLLGLPVELYESSLCITQNGVERVSAPGVGEGVGATLFAQGGSFSAADAERRLGRAHRELQHLKGRGGRIAELEERLSVLVGELTHSKESARRLAELQLERRQCREELDRRREELKDIAGALERIEIERILQTVRERDAAAQEGARLAAGLAQLDAEAPVLDGPVIEALTRLLHRCETLRIRLESCEAELARAERTHTVDVACAADAVDAMGGGDAVLRRVEKKRGQKRISAATGTVFLILAVVSAALALWRAKPLLWVVAGIAAAISLLCAVAHICVGRSLRGMLRALRLPSHGMLRTYLEQLRQDADAARERREQLAAIKAEKGRVQLDLEESTAALSTALLNVGRGELAGDPVGLSQHLAKESERREARLAAQARLTPELERARGVVEALDRRLEGVSEQALSKRLAELPVATGSREELEARRAALTERQTYCEMRCIELERAESAQAAACTDPDAIAREKALTLAELTQAKARLAAIQLAQTALAEAAEEMKRSITPRLGQRANEIFGELTGHAHGLLRLAADFTVTLEEMGVPQPLSRFSAGCADAAHLSLRLAVLEAIAKEPLPLLLDESLARLDDRRAAAMLSTLVRYCGQGGQCILLTCHGREASLLANMDVKRLNMHELCGAY